MTDAKFDLHLEIKRAMMHEIAAIAAEMADAERARLGRELTKTEIGDLVAMIERQYRTAVALSRR